MTGPAREWTIGDGVGGQGYATRALELLLVHLARATEFHTATLLIDVENVRSLAVARRSGFTYLGDFDGNPYFARVVPDARSPVLGDGMDRPGHHPQG